MTLLTPVQYVLFMQEWRDTTAILAMDNLQNNIAASADMLNGDGLFVTMAQEITIPNRGLAQVGDILRAIWLKIPAKDTPLGSFASLHQVLQRTIQWCPT